jgi:Fanconi anemia group J protein
LADHYSLNTYRGKSDAWDLEDIVKVGKKVRACPYYAIRELKNRSHIIFCPYNYLVEPTIRKSMEISLKNNIVILDEAHNIEDSARSAAGWQVSQTQIRDSMQDLEKMAVFYRDTQAGEPEPYFGLAKLCSQISNWMDEAKEAQWVALVTNVFKVGPLY